MFDAGLIGTQRMPADYAPERGLQGAAWTVAANSTAALPRTPPWQARSGSALQPDQQPAVPKRQKKHCCCCMPVLKWRGLIVGAQVRVLTHDCQHACRQPAGAQAAAAAAVHAGRGDWRSAAHVLYDGGAAGGNGDADSAPGPGVVLYLLPMGTGQVKEGLGCGEAKPAVVTADPSNMYGLVNQQPGTAIKVGMSSRIVGFSAGQGRQHTRLGHPPAQLLVLPRILCGVLRQAGGLHLLSQASACLAGAFHFELCQYANANVQHMKT